MKLSYDKETDSLYIHLSNTPSVDSDEVADGVVLDFDSKVTGHWLGLTCSTPARRLIFNPYHCCICL
jgi:uncharacterized protein YuzE